MLHSTDAGWRGKICLWSTIKPAVVKVHELVVQTFKSLLENKNSFATVPNGDRQRNIHDRRQPKRRLEN